MNKYFLIVLALLIVASVFISGCVAEITDNGSTDNGDDTSVNLGENSDSGNESNTDLDDLSPPGFPE